ncbi:MAG: glycerol-3-phosphate acyltransferase [Chloroflexota bacterium]
MLASGILAIAAGYLLGSIPFAYILARAVKGMDIRQSGNVGTLSVMRDVGTAPGFAVLALDMGKGSLSVAVAQWLGVPTIFVLLSGFAAVLGHCWPVYLRFQGGGAIAPTLGVFLVLTPREFGISFAIMAVTVLLTSNVRFGAAVGLVFLPLFVWWFGGDISYIVYSMALPLFLVLRNITKFKRELGTEHGRRNFVVDHDFTPWQTRGKRG